MFIAIILAITIGILAGIFTGLIPGIHINLISLIVLSSSSFLLQHFSLLQLCVFIISMAVTHTFLDSIPGVYLGAPDESMILAALPGHRMLLEGRGHQAVILTLAGSFFCLVICIMAAPAAYLVISSIYEHVKNYIAYALIVIVAFLIFKDRNRFWNLIMFFFSGMLGLIILNSSMENPLFPMLSGLFGVSILITSLFSKSSIPEQNDENDLTMSKSEFAKTAAGASIVGFIASFLPGFGSSQAAIVATQFIREMTDKGFLVLVGGINTVNMTMSLITLYALEKARNGAVAAMREMVGGIGLGELLMLLAASLLAGCAALHLGTAISRSFSKMITRVNYRALVIAIMLSIASLAAYFDGYLGLAALVTSASVGLLATSLKVGKNHLMGCLILPVILYLL